MALADRDYYGQPERTSSRLTPVVKALLIANIAIFVLDYYVLAPSRGYPPILNFGAFTIQTGVHQLKLWEFITFQFLHGNLPHILLNSLGLFFFGPWMERHLGARHFIIYYLLCGVGGAAFYTLISYIGILPLNTAGALVGASAGIYGIFIGVAVISPNMRVQLLFPPVELSMRQLAIGIIGISVVYTLFKLNNAGGHAGHLGGIIAGYFLMRYVPSLGRGPKLGIHRPRRRQRYESKLSPRSKVNLKDDNEIDAILDKVSAEGFQSLTDKEKAILKKAAGEK